MIEKLAGGRVETRLEGQIVYVRITRPKQRNALDVETMRALSKVIDTLERRPDVVAVMLCSEGPESFIAGGDLRQFATLTGEDAGESISRTMGEICLRWEHLPQLTLACIEGDTYGGGVEFALASDLRIMSRTSALHLAQSKFGLTTAWGGASRLVEKIGYSRALLLLLEAGAVDADEALKLGLVERLAEPGDVETVARQVADRAVHQGRAFVTGLKQVLHAARVGSRDQAMDEESAVFKKLWASEAHELKVAKFLRRKAQNDRRDQKK